MDGRRYDAMDGGGRISQRAAIENNTGAVIEGRGSRMVMDGVSNSEEILNERRRSSEVRLDSAIHDFMSDGLGKIKV